MSKDHPFYDVSAIHVTYFAFEKGHKFLGSHDSLIHRFIIQPVITAKIEPKGNQTPGYAPTYLAGSADARKWSQGLNDLYVAQTKFFHQGERCALGTILENKVIFLGPPLNAIQDLLLVGQNLIPVQCLLGDSLRSQFSNSGLKGRHIPVSFCQFLHPCL